MPNSFVSSHYKSMNTVYTPLAHFLIGIRDSLSPGWVTDVLFYTDPKTGRILPQSIQLQKTLIRSLIQAGLLTTALPLVVRWLGFNLLYYILTALGLLFTYAYLTFYTMDVSSQVMAVVGWRARRYPKSLPEQDIRQQVNFLEDIGNQIQAFIFEMVYYTPMNLVVILITLVDERYSPWVLVVMDCFFNTALYFFRKWPYDKYNVAFLEKNLPYSMGFGLFVSVVANIVLPPSLSITCFLLMSQWMIINAIIYTPPKDEFHSLGQIWEVLTKPQMRRKLKSAYNEHRKQLKNKEYQKQLIKKCYFMKSFFTFTHKINKFLRKLLLRRPPTTQELKRQSEDRPLSQIEVCEESEEVSKQQQAEQIEEEQGVVLKLQRFDSNISQ